MKPKSHCRVLVCDDVAIIRMGLQAVLRNYPEFELVGEAADGHEAIAKAVQLKPDLVLMDVSMPHLDGVEATRQILVQAPDIKVLAYSSDSKWETVDRMLAAGAAGYVVKGVDPDDLVHAASTVLSGGHYLSRVLLEAASHAS